MGCRRDLTEELKPRGIPEPETHPRAASPPLEFGSRTRFSENEALFGFDATQRIVAVEFSKPSHMDIFIRAADGSASVRTERFEPYLWNSSAKTPLDGLLRLDQVITYRDWRTYRSACDRFKEEGRPFFTLNDPVQQYLTKSGRTLFKGMRFILAKGYNYGLNFLPHDAAATMKSGRTFQGELHDLGLRNTRIVPRTLDIWIGINHLRELLPRFTFRIPACERALEMLQLYHTRRETSSGLAVDEPVHDFSSHVADCARLIAEAHMAGFLHSIASKATYRRPLTVKSGFRGDDFRQEPDSILDRFFARPRRNVRIIR
jgi:hypothetical protein